GADHFANADAGVRRGVALALESDADVGAVQAGIVRILSDPDLRRSAAAVSEEIAAMPNAAAAGDAILDWLEEQSSAV
ncbi:MAG TPA: hypothetical protein VKM54_07660, partial [Myxococcota bacterium]|nr:hypothetical protein [Myxococcota bacterium]